MIKDGCEKSELWDKLGLQQSGFSEEPGDFKCDGSKICTSFRNQSVIVPFLLTLHYSGHYLLTDSLNSVNQLHMTSTQYDITFEYLILNFNLIPVGDKFQKLTSYFYNQYTSE